MNPKFHFLLIFLLFFSIFHKTLARGGGHGRGRSGARGVVGGRAKSGIRGNSARGRIGSRGFTGSRGPSARSGIRGSSSYSGGVRSGAHGYKVQSKTSSSDFGSSTFRTAHFGHNTNIQIRPGHPMVVLAATTPILFDNRNYYWSYSLARSENNSSQPPSICEYVFGKDDGELQNATFVNGTLIKAIYFGCSGRVNCCGMYCCHDFSQWLELLFVFGFIAIIIFIATYARKHEKDGPQPYRRKKRKQKKGKNGTSFEVEKLTPSVSQIVNDNDSLSKTKN